MSSFSALSPMTLFDVIAFWVPLYVDLNNLLINSLCTLLLLGKH